MKILVMSDSHGNFAHAFKAHELAGAVDHIVHLGDGAEDARLLEEVLEVPVIRIAGNCDIGSPLPHERLISFGDAKVLITHGNRYQVKSGLGPLERRGVQLGAAVVLYGHTHLPRVETREGVLLVNPGELQSDRGSYAILTIEKGSAGAELYTI